MMLVSFAAITGGHLWLLVLSLPVLIASTWMLSKAVVADRKSWPGSDA